MWLAAAGGVLVVTAAVIRSGHTLLDRLMVALLLLLGAGITAGLLFTVWPWGLAPVPIAGTAISVLGLFSVFGGRDLRLPRPTLSDGAVVGAAPPRLLPATSPVRSCAPTARAGSAS